MLVKEILLKVLEDLLKYDFAKFKWYLTQELLPGCEPIARASLEDASRFQTVDLLVRHYGEETAVKVTAEALNMMTMNKAKEELMRLYTAGESDTNTTQTPGECSHHSLLNIFLSFFHLLKKAHHLLPLPPPPPLLRHLLL